MNGTHEMGGDNRLQLEQAPEGSPSFCFGLYRVSDGSPVLFVQSDWDYAGLASSFGWVPCPCGSSDGTVDCRTCGRTVSVMLAEAFDWLSERDGETFDGSDYIG